MIETLIGTGVSQVNGGHNFVMLCLIVILAAWISRVTGKLLLTWEVMAQLENTPCLLVEYFSIYAEDIQMLIRNHFNQILRMRRTVQPDELPKQHLLVHLVAETISIQSNDKINLQFQVMAHDQSMITCTLLWCVPTWCYEEMLFKNNGPPDTVTRGSTKSESGSASNESVTILDPAHCSDPMEIRFNATEDAAERNGYTAQVDVELPMSSSRLTEISQAQCIPLVILLHSHSPARGILQEYSFCKIAPGKDRSVDVAQQIVPVGSYFQEVQGIYGFEDSNDRDCMICYDSPKNVMLLPCRHCSVCANCLRSLRDEKCPLCRTVFSTHVIFPSSGLTEEKRIPPRIAREPAFQRSVRIQPRQSRVGRNLESADQAEPLLSSTRDELS